MRRFEEADDFNLLSQSQLSGPATMQEVANWPLDLLNRTALRPGAQQQIRELLHSGLKFTTDYSGMDCPREAMHLLKPAMAFDRTEVQISFMHA